MHVNTLTENLVAKDSFVSRLSKLPIFIVPLVIVASWTFIIGFCL